MCLLEKRLSLSPLSFALWGVYVEREERLIEGVDYITKNIKGQKESADRGT